MPSVMQGATANLAGMAAPKIKEEAEAFRGEHPALGPAAELGGALATAPLWPAKAGLALRGALGAGAAGVSSVAGGEGPMKERLKDAALPAAAGGLAGLVLPAALNKVGRVAKRAAQPFKSATSHVADGAGPLLGDDAAAAIARQEALAPGTATPVSVTPGMAQSTRVIGANAPVAREAQKAADGRLEKIQSAMEGMSPQYEALLGKARGPLDLGKVNIRPVIIKNGLWPGDETIELTAVQALRNAVRGKMDVLRVAVRQGKGGGPKLHQLGKDFDKLTSWLKEQVPDIAKLDADYGVLARARRAEEKVIKHIGQSRSAYGSSRVAGMEPGSPGASLPSKSNMLGRMFGPDRSRLAEEANRLLLQPGQIPIELLRARMRQAKPYQPGLLAPFAIGEQAGASSLFD
jgi:hypothetical protein